MTIRRWTEVFNELAVVALTVAVALGLERLFTANTYMRDLMVLVGASHLLAIACRRAGFGVGVSAIVSTAGLLIVGNVVLFPETAGQIVPSRETFDLLGDDLSLAWTTFSAEAAPVDPLRGFIAAAGAALWWAAALADWAAFRLRSQLETIAPATALFAFTALLGDGSRPAWHGGLYATAVAALILTTRLTRRARDEIWIGSRGNAGLSATMRGGAIAAALAIAVGVVTGPEVPDAGDQLLDPSEWDNGPATRRVLSPLVEINASLVEQSRLEMFSVKVLDPADRSYWRQMALTTFDGRSWSRSSNFDDIRGSVGSDIDASIPRRTIRQEITTRSLGGIYLPAAYEVAALVDSQGIGIEYEVETGALVVTRESEADALRGFSYVIDSRVPDYSPAALPVDATTGLSSQFLAEYTALPPSCSSGQTSTDRCWPDSVTGLAEEITANAASDFERARLLQDHFLESGNFEYDLNVAQRHDVNSIEDFLFIVEAGYCEQFASTFASMARSIGLPARVAVGFTWGEWNDARQEYIVRGEHAHAWPEVYFAGAGWVVFDPTPGRAPAGDTDVTGQSPAQLYENDEVNRGGAAPSPSTIPPALDGNSLIPDQQLPDNFLDSLDPADLDTEVAVDAPGAGVSSRFIRLILAVFGVAVILGIVPAIRIVVRRRRFARIAGDPLGRSEFAWDEAAAALRLVGIGPEPSETAHEFAQRTLRAPGPVGPVGELADSVTILRYAALTDPQPYAQRAEAAASAITTVCRSQVRWQRKLGDALDPRTIRQN